MAAIILAGCASPPPPPSRTEPAASGHCAALYRTAPARTRDTITERVAAAMAEYPDEAAFSSRPVPKTQYRAGPDYPTCALMYGITEARCDMVLDVRADGLPENIEPVCSHAMFEEASVTAAQKWRFEPAMKDGAAVMTKAIVAPIIFLAEHDTPPASDK